MMLSGNAHSMNPIKVRKKVFVFVGSLLLVFFLTSYLLFNSQSYMKLKPSHIFHKLPRSKLKPQQELDWYLSHCFSDKFSPTVSKLYHNIELWSTSSESQCLSLLQRMRIIFHVHLKEGMLKLPDEFKPQVLTWLGNDDLLMKEVYAQRILHVYNGYTNEHTVFNRLRSKRPITPPSEDMRHFVDRLAKETKDSCDFCKYKTRTAADIFGRIIGEHSVSISNLFKFDKWHAMFLTDTHHPIDIPEKVLLDTFHTALRWFQKVYYLDSSYIYPTLLWDVLPHSGASQIHPHIHGVIDNHRYHGINEVLRLAAENYLRDNNRNYWSDLVEIHQALSLAVTVGNATAFAYLGAHKDHEVWILSPEPCDDFFRMIYYVLKAYTEELNQFCFSSGMSLPLLNGDTVGSLPALMRIGSRGVCNTVRSDASSLELFTYANVNVDPYITIEKVRNSVRRHSVL